MPLMGKTNPDTCITLPKPTIKANTPICEGGTLKLETSSQEGSVFHWLDPQGKAISIVSMATMPNMTKEMTGRYSLRIEKDACFSEVAYIDIELLNRPDTPFLYNNGPVCEGQTLLLDGPSIPNATYKWIDPFGSIISVEEDVLISNVPKELAGAYFLEITQAGCKSPLGSTTVGIIPKNEVPTLNLDKNNICVGDTFMISTTPIEGATYTWTGPNGFRSNQIDSLLFPRATSDLSGKYTLVVEAEGCQSPTGEIAIQITENPPKPLISGAEKVCPDATLKLRTNKSKEAATYHWKTPMGDFDSNQAELEINNISDTYAGDYQLIVVSKGCYSPPSELFEVEITIPNTEANAGEDLIICGNESLILNAEMPLLGTGKWSTNSLAIVENPLNARSKIYNLAEGNTTFYWQLSTAECPNYGMDSVNITYYAAPTAEQDAFLLEETEQEIHINVLENDLVPNDYFSWVEILTAPAEGILNPLDSGSFSYQRPFSDFRGKVDFDYLLCYETENCPALCDTSRAEIEIFIDPLNPNLFIPDGFTPNNDGKNDVFEIRGIEQYPENELIIFDRWGNLVFEAKPYQNDWKGDYKNQALPEGTYYFVLKTDLGNKRTIKSRVYLLR
jgi:gliding motility-associated-like protein